MTIEETAADQSIVSSCLVLSSLVYWSAAIEKYSIVLYSFVHLNKRERKKSMKKFKLVEQSRCKQHRKGDETSNLGLAGATSLW